MSWSPISLTRLRALIAADLENCSPEWPEFFERTRIEPQKWALPPWGDLGGGFWVAAMCEGRVLWYNDVEEGFNVSALAHPGRIDEYWCNQSEICSALPSFAGQPAPKFGPPIPFPE